MRHSLLTFGLILVLSAAAALPARAATVMVGVRADFAAKPLSPSSLARADQMVNGIEGSLMEQLFDAGHIAFNLPIKVRTPDADGKPLSVDDLLWSSAKGGAEYFVYCTVLLQETGPNLPVKVLDCQLVAYGVHGASGFPLRFRIPVGEATVETDLQPRVAEAVRRFGARL